MCFARNAQKNALLCNFVMWRNIVKLSCMWTLWKAINLSSYTCTSNELTQFMFHFIVSYGNTCISFSNNVKWVPYFLMCVHYCKWTNWRRILRNCVVVAFNVQSNDYLYKCGNRCNIWTEESFNRHSIRKCTLKFDFIFGNK